MSNICDGQQQQANSSKTVSLSVHGNKMNLVIVLLAVSVVTLLESPAPSETSRANEPPLSVRQVRSNRLAREHLSHHHRRATRNSPNITTTSPTAAKMHHLGPKKRPSQATRSLNHMVTTSQQQSKRFRSSLEEESSVSRESAVTFSNSTTGNRHHSDNDVNNNNQTVAPIQDDNNNNTVYPVVRTRQVSSLNGTIDLSRYEQDDVERLYSDALLVYVKNFNETLPVRRELLSLGGNNRTSRIPIYRSDIRGADDGSPKP